MDLADQIQSLRGFLEIAKAELRSTEQELAKMQSLMVTREEIKGSIFGLEKMIERMEAQQKNTTAKEGCVRASDIMKGGQHLGCGELSGVITASDSPIWRGAQQVLESAKSPMSAPDITELLQAMGWPISGDTPVETVRTALARKPDVFERTDRGMFKLKNDPNPVRITNPYRKPTSVASPPPEPPPNWDKESK